METRMRAEDFALGASATGACNETLQGCYVAASCEDVSRGQGESRRKSFAFHDVRRSSHAAT